MSAREDGPEAGAASPGRGGASVTLTGRVIRAGAAEGAALVSAEPVSFYGGVDLQTGEVVEPGHPLEGERMAGRILVIPRGKGSTVGSWALLRLARRGAGPAGIVCGQCETIVAVGAILAEIPCVDRVPIDRIPAGAWVRLEDGEIEVVVPAGGVAGQGEEEEIDAGEGEGKR